LFILAYTSLLTDIKNSRSDKDENDEEDEDDEDLPVEVFSKG